MRAQDGTLDRLVLRFEQFCPNSLDPMRGDAARPRRRRLSLRFKQEL